MALTDLQVKQASPKERDWKFSDGGGLYLLIRPNGSKLWRMKYRHHGKEKKLSFGSYPEVGLKDARLRRDEARVEIGRGGDPARRKREDEIAASIRAGDTFEAVAFEFIAKREAEGLTAIGEAETIKHQLEALLTPPMSRTERPASWEGNEPPPKPVRIEPHDLDVYRHFTAEVPKNLKAATIAYWLSVPLPAQALGDRYQITRGVEFPLSGS